MTINELAEEYELQARVLDAKIDAIKPLLMIYKDTDLALLKKRICIYYNLSCECKRTALLLKGYYE